VYLVYLLLLWLLLRIYRRVRSQARRQQLTLQAKSEGVLQSAKKNPKYQFATFEGLSTGRGKERI